MTEWRMPERWLTVYIRVYEICYQFGMGYVIHSLYSIHTSKASGGNPTSEDNMMEWRMPERWVTVYIQVYEICYQLGIGYVIHSYSIHIIAKFLVI